MQWADLHTLLPGDLLTKVDRSSMAHSLEVRPPFLDHRLVEFALSVDASLLRDVEGNRGKLIVRQLMERDPHQVLEGIAISCYAIASETAYIYIRGEFRLGARILEQAIQEAQQAGYLGSNVLGSGLTINIYVHAGAGAYICGEETALLESLEGKRGKPRAKPPFPATHGLYQKPTVVNNVETLANLPYIINRGPEWFASIGSPPKSTGTRVFIQPSRRR